MREVDLPSGHDVPASAEVGGYVSLVRAHLIFNSGSAASRSFCAISLRSRTSRPLLCVGIGERRESQDVLTEGTKRCEL